MNAFDHEVRKARLIEIEMELAHEARVARADKLSSREPSRLRAWFATWLIRTGLWLDPRVEEGIAPERSGAPRGA